MAAERKSLTLDQTMTLVNGFKAAGETFRFFSEPLERPEIGKMPKAVRHCEIQVISAPDNTEFRDMIEQIFRPWCTAQPRPIQNPHDADATPVPTSEAVPYVIVQAPTPRGDLSIAPGGPLILTQAEDRAAELILDQFRGLRLSAKRRTQPGPDLGVIYIDIGHLSPWSAK
jgi:hypothetical protein